MSDVMFTNCKGEKVKLKDTATLAQLTKLGVRLWLEPKESPKPDNPAVFWHDPEDNINQTNHKPV